MDVPGSPDTSQVAVAYVLTDYPRLAMTFITGEIDEIRRNGGRVVPISMNRPGPADVVTAEGQARRDDCLYLKSAAVVGATVRVLGRHPGGVTRVAVMALRSAGFDVLRALRRMVHLAYAARVVEHCRPRGVRHLHAHFGQAPATIAWLAASLGNLEPDERWTWSLTAHGTDVYADADEVRLDLKVADAAAVVAISEYTRSQVLRHCAPEHWGKVSVVRCGIDLDSFAQREAAPKSATPVVTTVGRLAAEKGQTVLLEAVALLRDRGVDLRAEIIGGGPMEQYLRSKIEELGLEDRVVLVGELVSTEVVRRLRESAVFCLPSFAEGLPVAMMEAMAIGVPVVSTHVDGIPELAVNHVSALTVAPGNVEELASALAATLADPDGATQRANEARRLVDLNHSRPANVARLTELFVECAARSS